MRLRLVLVVLLTLLISTALSSAAEPGLQHLYFRLQLKTLEPPAVTVPPGLYDVVVVNSIVNVYDVVHGFCFFGNLGQGAKLNFYAISIPVLHCDGG